MGQVITIHAPTNINNIKIKFILGKAIGGVIFAFCNRFGEGLVLFAEASALYLGLQLMLFFIPKL